MPAEFAFHREALPPLAELEAEWRSLETCARVSFFLSWAWIGMMLDTIPLPERPALLRARTGGETAALALLGTAATRRRHGLVRARGLYLNETGNPQFDAMTIEHNAVLARTGSEAAALTALLDWFARQRSTAAELHLNGSVHPLPAAALECRRLLFDEHILPAFLVDLDRLGPGGSLDPILSANARQQLRRAIRRYQRRGPLELREAASEAEAQRWFSAMKRLHCASWARRNQAHSFSLPFFERFHRRLIERSFAEGGVQLLEARAGEQVIGYLYNFRKGGRIYAYQSGFDDADPRARPGYVAHALAIGHAHRGGMRVYDFLAGRNRLKQSFATDVIPMRWQVVQQPRLRFRLEHLARRVKHRLRIAQDCLLPSRHSGDRAGR
jgi:CelD/BcsL family acetyltransferase involved in cellulose biosynthesis